MRSLGYVRIRGRVLPVVPLYAVSAFLISLLVLLCLFFLLERRWSPGAGGDSAADSPVWYWEDKRINLNNEWKVTSRQPGFVWMSKGFPVGSKRPGARRILVMGDSFVWGDGYANMNDLWWRQLQRELAQRGYGAVEVVAAGYPGFSTRQQLIAARSAVLDLAPDLIVWGYTTNDPDEGLVRAMREDPLLFQDGLFRALNEFCRLRIFPGLSGRLRELRREKMTLAMSGQTNGYVYPLWELQILEGLGWARYQQTVADLKAFLRERAIPSFMVTLPSHPGREYHEARYAKVSELYRSHGIAFHDILQALVAKLPEAAQGTDVRQWGINPVNSHPGPAMTYLYALLTADILEADHADLLGPRIAPSEPTPPCINDWVPFDLNPDVIRTGTWAMEVPMAQKYMLRLPFGEPFIQLNLEKPVALRAARVHGNGLASATLTITSRDPGMGYDDGTLCPFGRKTGIDLEWDLSGQECSQDVNTIRFRMYFSTDDRRVEVTLVPMDGGVRE